MFRTSIAVPRLSKICRITTRRCIAPTTLAVPHMCKRPGLEINEKQVSWIAQTPPSQLLLHA